MKAPQKTTGEGFKELLKLTTKDETDNNKTGKHCKYVAHIKLKMAEQQ